MYKVHGLSGSLAQFETPADALRMGRKRTRIVDEELLSTVMGLPCMACGITPSHAHHVTTRGAGGDDVASNVMPLCGVHHTQWHLNPSKLIQAFPCVRFWLEAAERSDVLERYLGREWEIFLEKAPETATGSRAFTRDPAE